MEPGPPAAAAEVFGTALRQPCEQDGLSLRELGGRSQYDYSRLSRAENGRILIPEAQVRVLDDVLGLAGSSSRFGTERMPLLCLGSSLPGAVP